MQEKTRAIVRTAPLIKDPTEMKPAVSRALRRMLTLHWNNARDAANESERERGFEMFREIEGLSEKILAGLGRLKVESQGGDTFQAPPAPVPLPRAPRRWGETADAARQ